MDGVSGRSVAWYACIFLTLSGCGSMLDRPTPSREDYLAGYFEYFNPEQIEKLDYVYKGAIGGAMTVGRAKFKDSVKLRDSLIEARAESGQLEAGTYDPTAMGEETAAMEFEHQWKAHAGGTMPPWFDFPFDRQMRTLREASEGSDKEPRYEKVWYIDDERRIVYVRGNWG